MALDFFLMLCLGPHLGQSGKLYKSRSRLTYSIISLEDDQPHAFRFIDETLSWTILFFFKFIYLFILRERESESEQGKVRETGRERVPSRL